jgi:hypothetical protein
VTYQTRRRIATVIVAPSAALAAWALTRLIGVDLAVSTGDGTVGPTDVFAAAFVGALAGWVAAWVLERRSRRPRATWSFAASSALAVSMIWPSWLADGTSAVSLMTMHFVTAAVLIIGFAGTLPAYRGTTLRKRDTWA